MTNSFFLNLLKNRLYLSSLSNEKTTLKKLKHAFNPIQTNTVYRKRNSGSI
jgi:hypothetical protein